MKFWSNIEYINKDPHVYKQKIYTYICTHMGKTYKLMYVKYFYSKNLHFFQDFHVSMFAPRHARRATHSTRPLDRRSLGTSRPSA